MVEISLYLLFFSKKNDAFYGSLINVCIVLCVRTSECDAKHEMDSVYEDLVSKQKGNKLQSLFVCRLFQGKIYLTCYITHAVVTFAYLVDR
jgi:hypothetical protein